MILVVDEALFEGTAVRDVDRLALLRLIALRKHGMTVQATPRPRGSASTTDILERWRAGLGGSLNSEVNLLVRQSQHLPVELSARPGERVLVSNRWEQRADSVLLSLEEALRVLSEPLHILVENGLRDAAFLRRILPPDWATRLSEWESTGRVRFEHAGGLDEMLEIVSFMAANDNTGRTWGMPARAWGLLHFLVFDHDGASPERCSAKATAMKAKCRSVGLAHRCHMLERRCQENYLPRKVMESIASAQLTDSADREQMLAEIDGFFSSGQPRRTHGTLPTLGSDKFWKGRFWKHRSEGWAPEWFSADGSAHEAGEIAAAIERCL